MSDESPGQAARTSALGTVEASLPFGLRVAASWAARLLVLGVFVVALYFMLAYFALVTVPVMMALLLTALLAPLVRLLERAKLSRTAAAAIAVIVMVLILSGGLTLVGAQTVAELPNLVTQTVYGMKQVIGWLSSEPLNISTEQVQYYLGEIQNWAQSQATVVATMAAALGASVGTFLAGMLTVLLATVFFLIGGRGMWSGIADWLLPEHYAARITTAAQRGWGSLVSYMQATLVVCFTIATAIAVAAWILKVPMPVALFALTFVAAFIPIVGALLAGMVAVALALVNQGPVTALIMLAIVILVNVLTANVLAPLLTSKATSLHPLAIVLGLTAGATLAGIVGALFIIPVMAFLASFAKSYRFPDGRPPAEPVLAEGDPSPGESAT